MVMKRGKWKGRKKPLSQISNGGYQKASEFSASSQEKENKAKVPLDG
jgi:hypothetical protein